MKDVLVFTPVLRLEAETVGGIFEMAWEGALSALFQRDSRHIAGLGIRSSNVEGEEREKAIRNHLHQYQRGRDFFLAGPFEAMLVIESDIIPPRDTLQRLARLDADLAYGCYEFQQSPVVNVAFRYGFPPGRAPLKGPNYRARNVGESLSVRPGMWQAALEAGVVDCSGAGLGCVLIKRHVLEAVEFRIGLPESKAFCDSYFTIDCYRAGYVMKADVGVMCGHKTVTGEIKYPQEAAV